MKKQTKILQLSGIALLLSFATSAAIANEIATEQIGGSHLSLSPKVTYDNAYLNVGSISAAFRTGEMISVDLLELGDGIHQYHLTLTTEAPEAESDEETIVKGDSLAEQSGQLRIIYGNASAYNDDIAEAEAEAENEINNDIALAELQARILDTSN